MKNTCIPQNLSSMLFKSVQTLISSNIGLIDVFEVVNIRRGPKNDLTPECEARGC